ncbi:hypothetical protein MPSEU_000773200 [Mayamaea pseudoterrestris]|nr:hypothetical protein MPSEU_000773200 [Mayamaea pseudoterrestris]
MDQRKSGGGGSSVPSKRPRSQTPPTRGEKDVPFSSSTMINNKKKSKPSSKKKKDKNKNRNRSDSVSDSHHHGRSSSHHHHHHHGSSGASTTTTAEGQRMTRILSTLTPLEHSRYNAYQESVLSATAVEQYVAACLSERLQANGASTPLQLADLVVPGQDQDIVMVVATLAKIYAQRLVTAAVQLRAERTVSAATSEGQGAASMVDNNNNHRSAPLQPRDILHALEDRQRQGLDPGFFLQTNARAAAGGSRGANTIAKTIEYHDLRVAAMAAERAYDEQFETSEAVPNDKNDSGITSSSPMQVDDE